MQGQSLRRIVPAPSPGCTHPAHPQVASGPLRTERDLTDITVESGRAWGKPAAVPAGLGGSCPGSVLLCGRGWAAGPGATLPSAWRNRSEAWAGRVAVQGDAPQSSRHGCLAAPLLGPWPMLISLSSGPSWEQVAPLTPGT